jgi:hypothetical protein
MLHRKILFFYKQLLSPIIVSAIIGSILYLISLFSEQWNIVISLIFKTVFSIIVWGIYIQYTKEYDIISKVKKITLKIKKR